MRVRKIVGGATLIAVLAAVAPVETSAAPPPPPPPAPSDELTGALAESDTGTVRVTVTLEAATTEPAEAVEDVLEGTESEVVSELPSAGAAVAEVDADGVDALLADPAVAAVTVDREYGLLLDSSTSVIASNRLNRAGVHGDNWQGSRGGRFEVAVVDTGIAGRHNALRGRVVSEACFSSQSACPNGGTSQLGRGAGGPCTFSSDCIHGTHVAGTAAGGRYRNGHEGVAPGARLIAIRIGHRGAGGRWQFFSTDLDRALQRVLDLRRAGRNIAAVNLSIGGGAFTSPCGASAPSTERLAARLHAAGVAVIAAAGNDGFANALSYPACLPSVYAVSATDDADRPTSFSNVATMTDWFAPGVDIDAPIPGGPNAEARLRGTSMSTPHVAGAFALLRECIGNGSPAAVAKDLRASGRRVTDSGITRPRINVFKAATRNVPNDKFANARRIRFSGRGVNIASWNVCASREPGEPGPGKPQDSVWFVWRPARSGRATISTNNGGGHRTTFNTELTVFTGKRLRGLRRVAYDNNDGKGTRSKITMRVRRGTTYRIRVDGVNAQNGRFNLQIRLSR
jgi:subtilisin family serine protease